MNETSNQFNNLSQSVIAINNAVMRGVDNQNHLLLSTINDVACKINNCGLAIANDISQTSFDIRRQIPQFSNIVLELLPEKWELDESKNLFKYNTNYIIDIYHADKYIVLFKNLPNTNNVDYIELNVLLTHTYNLEDGNLILYARLPINEKFSILLNVILF